MNEPFCKELIAVQLRWHIENQMKWYNSPTMVAARGRWAAEWAARPWYERVWIRARVKFRNARIWLGEKIAGREFGD